MSECSVCKFWCQLYLNAGTDKEVPKKVGNHDLGWCRMAAPTMVWNVKDQDYNARWPETKDFNSCGDFLDKESEVEKLRRCLREARNGEWREEGMVRVLRQNERELRKQIVALGIVMGKSKMLPSHKILSSAIEKIQAK